MATNNVVTVSVRVATRAAVGDISSFGRAIQSGIGNVLATAFNAGLQAAQSFFSSAIAESRKLESALVGLSSVAAFKGVTGSDASAAIQNLSAVRGGLLSVGAASQGLKDLLLFGYDLEKSVALLEAFSASASFGGQSALSFDQKITHTSEGLKNLNSILFDASGITTNISVLLARDGLTMQDHGDAAKKAAVLQSAFNQILKETEPQANDVAKVLASSIGKFAQYEAAQKKLLQTVGKSITESKLYILTLDTLTKALNGLAKSDFSAAGGNIAQGLGVIAKGALYVVDAMQKAKVLIELVATAFGLMVQDISLGIQAVFNDLEIHITKLIAKHKATLPEFLHGPLGFNDPNIESLDSVEARGKAILAARNQFDKDKVAALDTVLAQSDAITAQTNAAIAQIDLATTAGSAAAKATEAEVRNIKAAASAIDAASFGKKRAAVVGALPIDEKLSGAAKAVGEQFTKMRDAIVKARDSLFDLRAQYATASGNPFAQIGLDGDRAISKLREGLRGATEDVKAMILESINLQGKLRQLEFGKEFLSQLSNLAGIDARIASLGGSGVPTAATQFAQGQYGQTTPQALAAGTTQVPIIDDTGQIRGYQYQKANDVTRLEARKGQYGQYTGEFDIIFDEAKYNAQQSFDRAIIDQAQAQAALTERYLTSGQFTDTEAREQARRQTTADTYNRTLGFGKDDLSDAQAERAAQIASEYRADQAKALNEAVVEQKKVVTAVEATAAGLDPITRMAAIITDDPGQLIAILANLAQEARAIMEVHAPAGTRGERSLAGPSGGKLADFEIP